MEESAKQLDKNSVNAKYIKNLRLEPIDICFTLRSSPGHSLTTSLKNVIGIKLIIKKILIFCFVFKFLKMH